QPPARPAALAEHAVEAGRMTRGQRAQSPQEIADRTLSDGKKGGQGQDEHAQKGRPGEGTRQGLEEGTGRLRQVLMDALQLTPSGTRLARAAAALFAVETSAAALVTVG